MLPAQKQGTGLTWSDGDRGGIVVNGRIDLIRRTDTDEVVIVDFKSDERAQAEDSHEEAASRLRLLSTVFAIGLSSPLEHAATERGTIPLSHSGWKTNQRGVTLRAPRQWVPPRPPPMRAAACPMSHLPQA